MASSTGIPANKGIVITSNNLIARTSAQEPDTALCTSWEDSKSSDTKEDIAVLLSNKDQNFSLVKVNSKTDLSMVIKEASLVQEKSSDKKYNVQFFALYKGEMPKLEMVQVNINGQTACFPPEHPKISAPIPETVTRIVTKLLKSTVGVTFSASEETEKVADKAKVVMVFQPSSQELGGYIEILSRATCQFIGEQDKNTNVLMIQHPPKKAQSPTKTTSWLDTANYIVRYQDISEIMTGKMEWERVEGKISSHSAMKLVSARPEYDNYVKGKPVIAQFIASDTGKKSNYIGTCRDMELDFNPTTQKVHYELMIADSENSLGGLIEPRVVYNCGWIPVAAK